VAGAEFIHVSARTLYAKPHRQAPFSAILPTPFGALGIIADAEYLREIIFLPGSAAALQPSGIPAEKAVEQLARYLADPDYRFDLPLAEREPLPAPHLGCNRRDPRGRTRTYSQLAESLGSVARAVGQACGDNPFPIVTPCHRVVSARA
jgi:methylated-DNA-[protein]-cysteine S-methyltransferase